MILKILYFLREDVLSESFFVEVLFFTVVSLRLFSLFLRAEELLPVDCCFVDLEDSAFWLDCLPVAGLVLTVSDDLLLETVLCPAVEFVLALLLTVVVDRFAFPLTVLVDRLVVPVFDPADCLLGAASEACLLLLLFPVEILDALSGCTLV